jgi:hypothetical protein
MLGACIPVGCPILLALTVVGRATFDPPDPLDVRLAEAFNAHQRRERRLGPDAVAAALELLRGHEVMARPSPWRLGKAHAQLTAEWFGGWVLAACEQDPSLDADAYRDRRLAQLAAGELTATIDHADVLMLQ